MNIKHSKEIIKYNQKTIYHLSNKYKYLNDVLSNEMLRDTLLKLYKFISDKDIFIYRHKYVFFIDNTRLTKLRGKTTASVSNRYINYLCAVGFINKQYQNLGEFGDTKTTNLTDVNYNFMATTESRRPINTFYFREYKEKELQRLEDRARQLITNGVTPGNISNNMLRANNCIDIANEVYYANNKYSINLKDKEYKQLIDTIDRYISRKGYTTKTELYHSIWLQLPTTELDKLFRIYKSEINRIYIYKSPTKQDKELYNLPQNFKKWIITERN